MSGSIALFVNTTIPALTPVWRSRSNPIGNHAHAELRHYSARPAPASS